MGPPLRDGLGPDVPERIADMIGAVAPAFPRERFLRTALEGYAELGLVDRGRRMAAALAETLPPDPALALDVLVRSLGPTLDESPARGMAPFVYLPHVLYVAEHGLMCFEAAMAAQHAITQRFTCEFGIRPFIAAEPERTFAVLGEWAGDPSEHVRRLVSEGTRPRLPWAQRLGPLVEDPSPVLGLLESLRDDPSEYVRRSVANNLNDVAKDHPQVVVATAERWMRDAGPDRRRLIRHALRTLAKAGDPAALAVLGYRAGASARVAIRVAPEPAAIGGWVDVTVDVAAPERDPEPLVVDLRVHFVKANGTTSPKVFRLRDLAPVAGERTTLRKRVSLRQQTTRTHHPGAHRVEVMVNGAPAAAAAFTLTG